MNDMLIMLACIVGYVALFVWAFKWRYKAAKTRGAGFLGPLLMLVAGAIAVFGQSQSGQDGLSGINSMLIAYGFLILPIFSLAIGSLIGTVAGKLAK